MRKRLFGFRSLTVIILGLVLFYLAAALEAGERDEEGIETVVVKEVSGEVYALNRNRITLIYSRDEEKGVEYEILLPFDKDVELVHKRSLDEIKIGDTVGVKYEETTIEYKDKKSFRRKAKEIRFIKAAPREEEPKMDIKTQRR